jgi:hypothetical protein
MRERKPYFQIKTNFLQEKPPSKKKKRGENLSPRHRKACHSISTALLQGIAEIGTQSAMRSSRKTLHELSPHIPQKTPKRNKSSSTNEMLHTDITVRAPYFPIEGTEALFSE